MEDCVDEFCKDFTRRWLINCPHKCDKKKTALTAKTDPPAQSPAAMAGSMVCWERVKSEWNLCVAGNEH